MGSMNSPNGLAATLHAARLALEYHTEDHGPSCDCADCKTLRAIQFEEGQLRSLSQGAPEPPLSTEPPDWLQKMALELPDLAAFIRAACGPIGWEYTVTTWATRLREYLAGALSQGAPTPSDEADAYNLAELIRAYDAIQAGAVSVPEPMRKAIAFGIHTIRGLARSQGAPEPPPTDADEPPWDGWFSCPDCGGWFNASPVCFDSGDEVCSGCAATRERPTEIAAMRVEVRDDAYEQAASIADTHWPEAGHVHPDEAVSCAMSISILIRRLKSTHGKPVGPASPAEEPTR